MAAAPEHWRAFLGSGLDDGMLETIFAGERTGRPLDDADFIARLEAATGREWRAASRDPSRRRPPSRLSKGDRYSVTGI